MAGTGGHIHDVVRERMFKLYKEGIVPPYLSKVAREHLQKGITLFKQKHLDKCHLYDGPSGLALFPWKGDKIVRTIALMLKKEAIDAIPFKSHIELDFTPKDSLKVAVFNILDAKTIDPIELIKKIRFLDRDKHDEFISIDLKRQAYAYSELDIEGALEFFRQLRKEL